MPAAKPLSVRPLAVNSYTAKLRSLFLLQEGGPWTDYVRPTNTGTTVGSGITVSGQLASFNGNGYIAMSDAYVPPGGGVVTTLLVRCKAASDVAGPGNYRGLYATNSFGLIQNFNYNWSHAGCVAGGGLISGALHTVGFSAVPSGTRYLYDGSPSVMASGCAPPFPNPTLGSGGALGIGGSAAGNDGFIGDIDFVLIAEDLTDDEIAAIVSDPWGVLFDSRAVAYEDEPLLASSFTHEIWINGEKEIVHIEMPWPQRKAPRVRW